MEIVKNKKNRDDTTTYQVDDTSRPFVLHVQVHLNC